jgi:hypothetical protein
MGDAYNTIRKRTLQYLNIGRYVVGLGAGLIGMLLLFWFMFHLVQGFLLFCCADIVAGSRGDHRICMAIQNFPEPIDQIVYRYVPYNPIIVMIVLVVVAYIAIIVVDEELQ